MVNVALFISGRLIGFKECLLPFVNAYKDRYNIYLFFSINTLSLDKNQTIESITSELKDTFGAMIGDIYFEEFKFPKTYVENRLRNNVDFFSYNLLSHSYNDRNNMKLIENFEINKNISFDVLCKTRSDSIFTNIQDFVVDNKHDTVIRHKHMMDIRHWGHIYTDTPVMISDSFAYGNKKSMKYYCETYDWILKNDIERNGTYTNALEIYLTDNLLQHLFYTIPHGGHNPIMSREEIDKYENNPNRIKFVYIHDIHYVLLNQSIRQKNNFIVNKDNVLEYTHR